MNLIILWGFSSLYSQKNMGFLFTSMWSLHKGSGTNGIQGHWISISFYFVHKSKYEIDKYIWIGCMAVMIGLLSVQKLLITEISPIMTPITSHFDNEK